MYDYLNKKDTSRKLKEKAENIIKQVQHIIKYYFTFSFRLIGSGLHNMITHDERNHIDLDYNLFIQKDKQDLVSNPQRIRELFREAFIKASGDDVITINKKNVIYLQFRKKIDGYTTSIDIAILCEVDDGYLYKIHYDPNNNKYIWNKIKESHDRQLRIIDIKNKRLWNALRNEYIYLKNSKDNKNEDSYILFLRAINNITMGYIN